MKKMKTLFKKDINHKATPEVQCLWIDDDGVTAHTKYDGSACMVKDGELYKRYDAKRNRKTGEYKTPPIGAIACCDPDDTTGHWPHWVRVTRDDKYHLEALHFDSHIVDGTYELCGPKVNGNREGLLRHTLLAHCSGIVDMSNFKDGSIVSYGACSNYIQSISQEGVVFHHPDGRKCKLRRTDFGFTWPN